MTYTGKICLRNGYRFWNFNPSAAFAFNPYGLFGNDTVFQEPMPGECIAGKWLLNRYLFARWGCVVRGTAMIRRRSWV